MRQLASEGRITIFKSLGLSKITHLLLVIKLNIYTINPSCKYRKGFSGKQKNQQLTKVLFPIDI